MIIRIEQDHDGTWRARFAHGAAERISPPCSTRSEALQWAADYFTPTVHERNGGAHLWL